MTLTEMPWGITDTPRPYRDELHFGYFGRLQTYWLTPTVNDLARHLRGGTKGHASSDLLGLCDDLVHSLAEAGIDVAQLMWMHTLLPYYLSFQSSEVRTKVMADLEIGNLTGLHFRMGIGSSSVKHPQVFRYCPACWRADLLQLGEVYIRRLFQLPGVFVCPEHDELLRDTVVPYRPLASRAYWNFTPPDATKNCPFVPASTDEVSLARLLALDSRRLLLQGVSEHPRVSYLAADYQRALQHLGLASRNVHPGELESMFLKQYPMPFLQKLGLAIEPGREGNWLRCFVRKTNRRFHPLQHILFRRFVERHLGIDCWTWMEAERWPCLSPMQSHPGPVAVTMMNLHFDAARDAWDGIFACACGFRYSAGGNGFPSVSSLRLNRVIAHSPHLHQRVAELAKAGCSAGAIASQLQLHRKTVRQWLSTDDRQKAPRTDLDLTSEREAWLTLVKLNPQSTLKHLRTLVPALFSRLYAYDALWLKSVQLHRYLHRTKIRQDYWQSRDEVLAKQVRTLAEEIRRRMPAVRVTLSRIGRELGVLNNFRKRLARLPAVAEVLASSIETVEAFQLRRLERALEQSPAGVSRRTLMQAAGLRRQKTRPAVMETIDRLFSGGEQS
ncbi:TnsD family Tn7-like transposition protein [Dechloromonas sp. A34]|uniref:TnsD family Tn7-like transposition protein n=1 Tax=Dechloromonas sp. A34 TaxID=447588 RepID=UPI0022492690|nr:TnsD family Tn7-like transposition protein [Dechloromonas sp. A34]